MPGEFARAALVALLVGFTLFAAAWLVYRDAAKAALLVPIVVIVFLSFDSVYGRLDGWEVGGVRPLRRMVVIPLTYLTLAAAAWAIGRIRRPLHAWTAFANVVVSGSLIVPAVALGRAQVYAMQHHTPMLPLPGAPERPAARPDIYYVIFDRYGDEETLRQHGLDNTPFYQYLEEKGFYLARESRSNYIKTILSLASSLNMSYLDPLANDQGPTSGNWRPVYEWAGNGLVPRFLKSRGYRYVHVGSWYSPTASSPLADRAVNAYTAVPFAAMRLLDSELIEPVRQFAATPLLDYRLQQWHRVRQEIDTVIAHAADPGPTFTFIHILVPHSPFVFNPDGSYVSADLESRRSRSENYINQVQAANTFARRLVDGILARAPSPPVIILQGDEGPYPEGTSSGSETDWQTATSAELREKSGILNAYHVPDGAAASLYPSISPVNSFRVVFNEYFGTRLDLLPDRVYGQESSSRPYTFFDVTDALGQSSRASVRGD